VVGECSYPGPISHECDMLWHTFGALQLLAMVLQFFGLYVPLD
jgi:hypothetical protein